MSQYSLQPPTTQSREQSQFAYTMPSSTSSSSSTSASSSSASSSTRQRSSHARARTHSDTGSEHSYASDSGGGGSSGVGGSGVRRGSGSNGNNNSSGGGGNRRKGRHASKTLRHTATVVDDDHVKDATDADRAKNFKVIIRVRPPLPREVPADELSYRDITQVERDCRAICVSENLFEALQGKNNAYPLSRFTFDAVFDQHSKQSTVYRRTARDAVLSTLEGYNATIFAYGQTGSGKTYTMEGFDSQALRGIIPRAVEEVFDYIQNSASSRARFLVRASYLQIYNEVISDLLKPQRTHLAIREAKKRGVFVEGLSEWVVRTPQEVYGLIKRGSSLRATSATKMNDISSRSHAVFMIIVEQNTVLGDDDGDGEGDGDGDDDRMRVQSHLQSFKVGKLNLVDLAGSERVSVSGATGQRLEETRKINKSLSCLGNVISALTDRRGTRTHIPYRDAKLTRILEDSLGGNCKTTMMAMVSPALVSLSETLSTLKFANRAKRIKNRPRINEDVDEKALLRKYERQLRQLRQELDRKSKNVVDKRQLIKLEDEKQRAEQDKMQALESMEQLSQDLMLEKREKAQLEAKIEEMNSNLLIGGDMITDAPAFKTALMKEQLRISEAFQQKLSELEREREQMEEEKQQTSRYKQILLKQRDIMVQLTARLNERDQSILLLQEELEAYDQHQRMMEDTLDTKTATLIALQKQISMASATTAASSPASRAGSPRGKQQRNGGDGGGASGNGGLGPPSGAPPPDSVVFSRGAPVFSPMSPAKRTQQQHASSDGLTLSASNNVDGAQHHQQQQSQSLLSSDEAHELRELRAKCTVQRKERTALKVILESKMKTLVDSICHTMLAPGGGGGDGGDGAGVPLRTRREMEVLQRLVNASLNALNHADAVDERDAAARPIDFYSGTSASTSTSTSMSVPASNGNARYDDVDDNDDDAGPLNDVGGGLVIGGSARR